jgi:protocatechuate 3,4-dioxygenase beta subunit
MTRHWLIPTSLATILLMAVVAAQGSPPGAAATIMSDPSQPIRINDAADNTDQQGACNLVTIGQGEISGYGWDDPGFKGARCVINNPQSWQAFWERHVSILDDPPPPPPVDFRHWIVLAAIQGVQMSGGGPHVEIVALEQAPGGARVVVIDDEAPGPLDIITNPWHIVKVNRRCLPRRASLCFESWAPGPEPGTIAGHVFGETPDGGEVPLGGALVRLYTNEGLVRATHTNNEGTYGFDDVPPGEYGMEALAEGFLPAEELVLVEPGQLTEQDFVLAPAPPPGAVAGHVFGANPDDPSLPGIPLGGALVRLFAENGMVRMTHTNNEGAYILENLPPGDYVMEALAEGYAPAEAQVSVASGQITEQNFLLEPVPPPGAIAGHVLGANPDDPNLPGLPIPGAVVRLFNPNGLVRMTHTNDQGFYLLEGVCPGEYGMEAGAPGFHPAQALVFVEPGQVTERNFLLEPVPPPGAIAGHVFAEAPDGGLFPVGGAAVRLFTQDGMMRMTHTNNEGAYFLEGVPPGEYGMVASAEGFAPSDALVLVEPDQVTEQNFFLQPPGNTDQNVPSGASAELSAPPVELMR